MPTHVKAHRRGKSIVKAYIRKGEPALKTYKTLTKIRRRALRQFSRDAANLPNKGMIKNTRYPSKKYENLEAKFNKDTEDLRWAQRFFYNQINNKKIAGALLLGGPNRRKRALKW